jgi:hypothetical protein
VGHDQINALQTRLAAPATRASNAPAPPAADVPVDELDLSGAVLGDCLILNERESLELHTVSAGRAAPLGSFTDAAAAWRALDDLDAPPR